MTRITEFFRRSNVPGEVAFLLALTCCVLAVMAAVGALRGNVEGARELREMVLVLLAVVGSLLAENRGAGRATDPVNATTVQATTTTTVAAESEALGEG